MSPGLPLECDTENPAASPCLRAESSPGYVLSSNRRTSPASTALSIQRMLVPRFDIVGGESRDGIFCSTAAGVNDVANHLNNKKLAATRFQAAR